MRVSESVTFFTIIYVFSLCYPLNCVCLPPPPKKNILQPKPPVPQNGTLFGDLHRGNQVKMRLFWWALIQYDWWPFNKEETRTQAHTEGEWQYHMEMRAGIYKPSNAKICQWATKREERGMEQMPPHSLRKNQYYQHLDFRLLASRTVNKETVKPHVNGSYRK